MVCIHIYILPYQTFMPKEQVLHFPKQLISFKSQKASRKGTVIPKNTKIRVHVLAVLLAHLLCSAELLEESSAILHSKFHCFNSFMV